MIRKYIQAENFQKSIHLMKSVDISGSFSDIFHHAWESTSDKFSISAVPGALSIAADENADTECAWQFSNVRWWLPCVLLLRWFLLARTRHLAEDFVPKHRCSASESRCRVTWYPFSWLQCAFPSSRCPSSWNESEIVFLQNSRPKFYTYNSLKTLSCAFIEFSMCRFSDSLLKSSDQPRSLRFSHCWTSFVILHFSIVFTNSFRSLTFSFKTLCSHSFIVILRRNIAEFSKARSFFIPAFCKVVI